MPTSGSRIALDTNAAIAILNDSDGSGRWVQRFSDLFLPVPAVGELRFGALKSLRSAENLRRIEAFVSRCHVLAIRLETTEVYARLRLNLRKIGKPIPENDLWIAALCVEHDLALATVDGHFKYIEELRGESPHAGSANP
jgi:tRNA(fMet)-specific endonuclease VapC